MKQPEALRLAEWLDGHSNGPLDNKHNAAAELRRLHRSEREGWRYADELEQERKRLHEANQMLLEALGLFNITCGHLHHNYEDRHEHDDCPVVRKVYAAIAKAGEA